MFALQVFVLGCQWESFLHGPEETGKPELTYTPQHLNRANISRAKELDFVSDKRHVRRTHPASLLRAWRNTLPSVSLLVGMRPKFRLSRRGIKSLIPTHELTKRPGRGPASFLWNPVSVACFLGPLCLGKRRDVPVCSPGEPQLSKTVISGLERFGWGKAMVQDATCRRVSSPCKYLCRFGDKDPVSSSPLPNQSVNQNENI